MERGHARKSESESDLKRKIMSYASLQEKRKAKLDFSFFAFFFQLTKNVLERIGGGSSDPPPCVAYTYPPSLSTNNSSKKEKEKAI